jgi:serine/threonine protein kinase
MFPAIKNYTIIREIGSGGMAAVYEAVDTRLQRTVALKVLHSHLCKEPTASDRFIREAKAAAKIDHPNVVRIFDFGSVADILYIVMEYVPGTNMERVLKIRGAVRPLITIEIMHQIAEALSQAHHCGIIHRDIKPGNILLHKQGRAMLSDFGLAHRPLDPHLTTHDAVAGTPSFMSPEQICGKQVTAASDIYSWGICFYTFITGKLPYQAQKFPEMIEEIRRGAVDFDSVLMANLPNQYHDLLSRCLTVDPAKRIGNAPELMRQFELIKKERSVDVDLRSLCGDSIDEYDTPRTSPSATAFMARGKRTRFFFKAAIVAAIIAIGGFISVRLLHRTAGPERIKSPVAASSRETTPRRAQKPEARVDSRSLNNHTDTSAKRIEKPVDQTARKEASEQLVADSLQAILDSFIVLSPEWTGADGYIQKGKASPLPEDRQTNEDVNAVADSGRLFIHCDPWATVYADDNEVGTTPFSGPVALPAGVHVIKLTNNNCETQFDTLTISPDSVLRKRYRLEAKQ